MTTVVIAPTGVADFADGGGHFWVYMQYVQGFRALGCDVYWLEQFGQTGDPGRDRISLQTFLDRAQRFGLSGKVMLQPTGAHALLTDGYRDLVLQGTPADSLCARADLLLNFSYATDTEVLSRFSKTALVDIDPGLLQFWMSHGQIDVPSHDIYFTTGETVGRPNALFPDCGIAWQRIRPIVSLADWPVVFEPTAPTMTTVSGWWGDEWISDGDVTMYQNNKRVSFLEFMSLASRTEQALELALCLGLTDEDDPQRAQGRMHPEATSSIAYQGDRNDLTMLETNGWKVVLASDVAASPEDYRRYIQHSRAEFSCAKPSCMKFQNAWVSDRSLCYLASGKPVIVQDTGPSDFLPSAEGMFRFETIEHALAAIETVNSDYANHCAAARALAETHFDAEQQLSRVLDDAL